MYRKQEQDSTLLAQVLAEIITLRQLDHPNIVKFFEAFESRAEIVIVTEFLDGGELFDRNPVCQTQKLAVIAVWAAVCCTPGSLSNLV